MEAVFSGQGRFDIEKLTLNGKSVLGAGANLAPWILYYKGQQGENPCLMPEHAAYDGAAIRDDDEGKTLVFTWQLTLDYSAERYPVRMYVSLPDGANWLRWNIEADLPEGWMVTDLEFPRIAIDRPAGGKVLTTEGWGVEKPLDIATFEARYPSHASSMQFIVVHNPEGAFYYGTEDRRGCGKTYSAQCTRDEVIFSDAVPASAGWIDEGTFRLPWESVAGFAPKGWEDAVVRWYRPFTYTTEWGGKTLASRDIPQWCYDADAWIRARHVADDTLDARPPRRRTLRQGAGHPLVLLAQPPLRHPLPRLLPGAAALRRDDPHGPKPRGACHALHQRPALGSRGRQLQTRPRLRRLVPQARRDALHGDLSHLEGAQHGDVPLDGYLARQDHRTGGPSPAGTGRGRHLHRPDRGGGPRTVLEREPPPPVGGGDFWYDGYRRLIGKIRDGHLQEGRILTSEENSECYIDLFDMLLVVNTPHNAENCTIRPVFPMVYSDRVITSGFTYTPLSTDLMTNGDFRYEMTKALLWGSQPGWVDPRYLMSKEAEREARFLKTLMDFRRGLHDVLYGGRFLRELTPAGDNPTMHAPGFGDDAAVLASEWQTPTDGGSIS